MILFSNFDCQRTFTKEGFSVKRNIGKWKFCMQNLTKERKQEPVVILPADTDVFKTSMGRLKKVATSYDQTSRR